MFEERSGPAGPIEAGKDEEKLLFQPATEDPGDESSTAKSTDAGSSSQNPSSSKSAPERAERELERQLETGEENPT